MPAIKLDMSQKHKHIPVLRVRVLLWSRGKEEDVSTKEAP